MECHCNGFSIGGSNNSIVYSLSVKKRHGFEKVFPYITKNYLLFTRLKFKFFNNEKNEYQHISLNSLREYQP